MLQVEVSGYAGSDLVGEVSVTMVLSDADSMHPFHRFGMFGGHRLNADGTQTLGPTAPGEYDVLLSVSSRQRHSFFGGVPLQTVPCVLVSGHNSIRMEIPPVYEVIVRFDGFEAGTKVNLQTVATHEFGGVHMTLDDSLRAEFERLPEGEYRVRATVDGITQQMTLRVPETREVVFQPDQVNAMRVTIDAQDGELAKAGLLKGDVLTAVNGDPFVNLQQMNGLLLAATGNEEATLTVVRDGKTMDLTVPARILVKNRPFGGRPLGGRLDPITYP